MASYKDVFGIKVHVVLPVVHVQNRDQCLRNVAVAYAEGADGAFLINHTMTAVSLLEHYVAAKQIFPNFWIGVNFLDLSSIDAIRLAGEHSIPGLWLDNPGIDEREVDPYAEVRDLRVWQRKLGAQETLIFGGVAFKYQESVREPAGVAHLASQYIDVVTTSGSGTGEPPEIEKIQRMREAIGNHPLAIASGISPENIEDYMPWTNCFLVATHISKPGTDDLDPLKVRELVQRVLG